jgi:hypothetical protein
MDEFKRIQEATDRVTDFQRKYNVSSKTFAYILGKNLTLFICMLIPLLMISFIWTEFGDIVFEQKLLSDGIITVLLFAVGETMMMKLGSDGGKLDAEYIEAKSEFDTLVAKVGEVGTMLMGVFCDWQIDVELAQAVKYRLRALKLTPQMWDNIKDLPFEEWVKKHGKKKAKKFKEINELEPIELNEAILLYNGASLSRGGVPVSGEEYLHSKSNVFSMVAMCVFTGLLTVSVVFTLTSDITIARVIYTVFKLVMLLFRMAKGYSKGAMAYNTVEVRQYKARSNYLRQYVTFVTDKTYLKIGEKYGDLSCYISDE